MENKEQDDTKAKTTTEHPKPSDEVQLTIETVTPDTVRTVPETAVDSKEVEGKAEEANSNGEMPKVDHASDEQPAKADLQGEEVKAEQETESVENIEDGVDEQDDEEAVENEGNESENVESVDDENSEGEEKTGAAESSENDNEEGDDERDKIETVAP
ncbi:hypothetical protein D3C87_716450 [compost metagenome]